MADQEEKDPTRLRRLIQLVEKVSRSHRHIGVDMIWDGKKFKWTVYAGGLDADELNLSRHAKTTPDS